MGDDALSADFAALAAGMPPTVRALLVGGVEPSGVSLSDLLTDLRVDPSRHVLDQLQAKVVSAPAVLDAASCAILRNAVDSARTTKSTRSTALRTTRSACRSRRSRASLVPPR